METDKNINTKLVLETGRSLSRHCHLLPELVANKLSLSIVNNINKAYYIRP